MDRERIEEKHNIENIAPFRYIDTFNSIGNKIGDAGAKYIAEALVRTNLSILYLYSKNTVHFTF
jgi:hypothetical protein